MALTKKEQEMVEGLKTQLALRWTEEVKPDVPPPSSQDRTGPRLTKGFLFSSYTGAVTPACSSSIYHSHTRDDEARSQGPRWLYSTRLLALNAMRHEVEKVSAERLRAIDKQIEAELAK